MRRTFPEPCPEMQLHPLPAPARSNTQKAANGSSLEGSNCPKRVPHAAIQSYPGNGHRQRGRRRAHFLVSSAAQAEEVRDADFHGKDGFKAWLYRCKNH